MRRVALLLCAALLPRAAHASVLASSSLETCFQGSAGGSTVSLRRVAHERVCMRGRMRRGAARRRVDSLAEGVASQPTPPRSL
jgi:hypothetical protein